MESEYRASAVSALAERAHEPAGDAYARAAWDRLAEPRPGQSPFDPDEKGWVGRGLQSLVCSAVCYRVAGRDDRAAHRAREGAALAADFENALTEPVQRACLREVAADCHVAGGLDGASEAYDAAETAYTEAGPAVDSPQAVATTALFQAALAPIQQVARGSADGEIAVAWEDLHGSDPADAGAFLAHRARFKRRRFPSLLARAVDDGHLAAPRGTTEYDNANFSCPDCGSTDVNWVADSTLCLRCSTPMVER